MESVRSGIIIEKYSRNVGTFGSLVKPNRTGMRFNMNILPHKKCTKCGKTKPVSEFHIKYKLIGNYRSHCKVCVNNKNKEYKLEHIEEEKKRSREYARFHRKENLEATKRWRDRNPDRARELSRKYASERPEKRRQYERTRRSMINGAVGKITYREELALFKKYDYRCLCCGRDDVKLTIDHIVPISRGGSNTIENAQPLCSKCNSRKGNRSTKDYR